MTLRAIILAFALAAAALPARADILVFAAASLKEPLDRIAKEVGDVVVSYGGSGTLARQISLGAPADVVLLANVAWMDVLVAGERVLPESVSDFASNRLVLIGQAGQKPVSLQSNIILEVLRDGRIAMGLTEAVPAGIYGKAALEDLGLWEAVQNQLAEVDNVRAALGLVARGQAPLGIVYRTDLRVSDAVTEVADFPSDSHPPIRYSGAVVRDAAIEAQVFWDYLRSPAGQAIMADAGFLPPAKTP
ncbi:molybdate ABC transporter substrate-binding protein [Yoonia sp.]|uniref:molybdate ABC transporter substrate-binding protein n=1 Tax=Yoonia sp. TaxID=2212373 RepID=UPI0023B6A3E6